MTRKRNTRGSGCLAVLLLVGAAIWYIETRQPPAVAPPAKPAYDGQAADAVRRTLKAGIAVETWRTGFHQGGVAVLADELAAYWVADDLVFACNGFARMWSPSIPVSASVRFHDVEAAVGGPTSRP